jgi:4'-phosphopantetheinyl transferase EntD
MNSAALSTLLGTLFPPYVVVAELREPGDPKLLLPAEAAFLGRAVPKRVQEFTAGRLCARRALAEFGIIEFPLRVAEDRQAVWPRSMVGSITHTAGFCAAVVAERVCASALGIDTEVVGHVTAEIWPRICAPGEMAWIESMPAASRAAAVTLIFSAKEAFYKCQFPLTREPLNFHDVGIEAAPPGRSEGTLLVHARRPIAMARHSALPLQGRYRYHEGFVTAGLCVAASAPTGS